MLTPAIVHLLMSQHIAPEKTIRYNEYQSFSSHCNFSKSLEATTATATRYGLTIFEDDNFLIVPRQNFFSCTNFM